MAEVNARPRATPKRKIVTRKTVKGRQDRAEGRQKKAVRARCATRDGTCRAVFGPALHGDTLDQDTAGHECQGPSEWAHLGDKRRGKTRGMAPEERHTTAGSLMLCRSLHRRYDGQARPRLEIEKLSDKGADGPLRFTRGAD
ncbi:MAG: hypothetical protein V4597_08405 [Pseudomonadota bacterium]